MPEIQLPKFDGGISRFSAYPELDRSVGNSVAEAVNVDFDELGNAYVCNGYIELTSAAGYGSVRGIYYCPVLNKVLVMVAGGIIVHNAETGAVEYTHNSIVGNTGRPSWGSWPATDTLYVSDGAGVFGKLTASGATWTDLSATAPRGRGILMVYKNHLLSAANLTDGPDSVSPSGVLTPETFSGGDTINFPAGGDAVTALSALNGVLHVHKYRTIYAVGGDTLSGTAKDLFRLNLDLGSGAVHHNLCCTLGQITYYFGFNGIHAFNGKKEDLVGNKLRQKLNKIYVRKESGSANFSFGDADYAWLVPFCPVYGPEAGRNFILVCLSSEEMFNGVIYKYDPLKDTVTEWEMGRLDNYVIAAAYAPEKNTTFCVPAGDPELVKFVPSQSWGIQGQGDVEGRILTHFIDPSPGKSKVFSTLESTQLHSTETEFRVGYDGFAPSCNLQVDTKHNLISLPEVQAYGMQIAIRRAVGGGVPLVTGLNLTVDGVHPSESLSWLASRSASAEYMLTNAPLYKAGTYTCAGGETSVTITHTLGCRPKFVMACLADQFTDLYTLCWSYTPTTFTVALPATASAGDKIHYIAVAEAFHTPTVGVVLGNLRFSAFDTYHYQVHDFSHWLEGYDDSGATFLNKDAVNNKAVLTSVDNMNIGAKLLTGGTLAERAQVGYFYRNGSDVSRWSVGEATVNASSITVAHGLGTTPTAVIAQLANSTNPGQGANYQFKLSSINSTNFTLSRSGANTLYIRWLAVK